jgi:hypothetical protein
MEFDPHAIHEILTRIQEQMRCPQCSKKVSVDFPSLKLAGDDFMLLQLKCDSCQAFIVLHVSLSGAVQEQYQSKDHGIKNVSSTLKLDEGELTMLKKALEQSGGSFEKLFADDMNKKGPKANMAGDGPSSFA